MTMTKLYTRKQQIANNYFKGFITIDEFTKLDEELCKKIREARKQ